MKTTIRLWLLLLPIWAGAQKVSEIGVITRQDADSLRRAVNTGKNDSLVMEACENLGFYYYESNYDSATYFLQKDLALAKKLSLKIWQADAYNQLGTLFQYRGDIINCYKYLAEAKALAEDESNENSNWHPWNFHYTKNFHDARIAIESDVYNNFGLFYASINEREKSKAAYYESIRLSQSINDNMSLGVTYMNVAGEYSVDTLLLLSKKALQYQDKSGYHRYRGSTLLQMAGAYYDNKQYDSATIFVYASMAEDEARNNLSSLSFAYNGVALFYTSQHKTDSAFLYAKKLVSVAKLTSNANIYLAAYKVLAGLYDSLHNVDSAYHYERLSNHLNDSLKAGKITQLTSYQTLAFNEQQCLQKLNDDKTAYQNKLTLYSVAGGLAAALIIALALYRNNRQKQQANAVLQTTLNNLKSTQAQLIQSEKMASLGELTAGIAHEIQNPLNFVNNFSEVNKEMVEEATCELKKGNYEEVTFILNDIKDNSEKINSHGKRADAIVKGMLQHSRQTKGAKEFTDINALCNEYLRLSYHGLRAKDKVFNSDFITDFDKTIGNINIVPQDIGRVLLNLYNNAFYAVNEKRKSSNEFYKPKVSVHTKRTNGIIEIRVEDNGNGIPQHIIDKIFQPFFTTKPTGQGTGLGLSLSYDIITKEHSGIIKAESREGEGSIFIIQLPSTL